MQFLLDVVLWWLVSLVLTCFSIPVAYRVFAFLPDRGLGLARVMGLLITSYVIFVLGFASYSIASIIIVWLALGGLGFWIYRSHAREINAFLYENRWLAMLYEGLFLLLLLAWSWVRMHHPEIVDQEKFMDFAFFNAIARADRFPPFDPWLAGPANHLNYYYFGYFIMSTFARLVPVDLSVAYNLVIAFIFALAGQTVFSIGYNTTKALWPGFAGVAFLQVFGNLDAGLQVLKRQSMDIDWWVSPTRMIHDVSKNIGGHVKYINAWWHNADPAWLQKQGLDMNAVKDAAISEFPNFSFLHGDMHPHLVALPFALLALALGLNLLKNTDREPLEINDLKPSRLLTLAGLALSLGCLLMMNTWDLPTYGLILSGCLLLHQYSRGRLDAQHWLMGWLVPSLAILAGAFLFAAPFLIFFKAPLAGQGSFLGVTMAKTGLRDTLVFWGLFLVALVPFLVMRLRVWAMGLMGGMEKATGSSKGGKRNCPECGAKIREGKNFCAQCGHKLNWEERGQDAPMPLESFEGPAWMGSLVKAFVKPGEAFKNPAANIIAIVALAVIGLLLVLMPTSALLWAGMALALLLALIPGERPEEQHGLLLIFMGMAVVAGVEWIYVRDAFSGDPNLVRMNTIFKFYFQAWILFSAAIPFALHWLTRALLRFSGEISRIVFLVVLSVFMIGAAAYPLLASMKVFDNYEMSPTLDGGAWLKRDYPGDYDAILKLRAQVSGHPVIAEAVGGSYTKFMRVSAYTGLPAPVGWGGHESQWRSRFNYPGVGPDGSVGYMLAQAEGDVNTLYSTMDPAMAQGIMKKYDIKYVFCGAMERGKYSADQLNKFSLFMDKFIPENQGTVVYKARN